jgi:diacylglycerol kinase
MKKLFNSHHPVRRIKSFRYAFEGVFHALINEPNFRIQLLIVLVSVFMGSYLRINNVEWGLLAISLGLLLAAEMINTVVEEILDHFFKEKNPVVKIVKDLAAGYVLVTSAITLAILILVFGPRLSQIQIVH